MSPILVTNQEQHAALGHLSLLLIDKTLRNLLNLRLFCEHRFPDPSSSMPEFLSNKPIRFSVLVLTAALFLTHYSLFAQNSLVGDGFGGRLWYVPCNYAVGSYSGYAVCGDACGKNAGQLYAWGTNQYGQLGIGTRTGITIPAAVPGMSNVKYFTAGYSMAAITSDKSG